MTEPIPTGDNVLKDHGVAQPRGPLNERPLSPTEPIPTCPFCGAVPKRVADATMKVRCRTSDCPMCLLEVLVDTWNDQHGAAAAVADAVKAEREDVLARLYEAGGIGSDTCCLIAQLCDEELDRSGGLLGRVREKAAAIREGADDDA